MNIIAREEVLEFTQAIEDRIAPHDEERGNTWKNMPPEWLLERLGQELIEYSKTNNPDELLDAAAFIMFIWHNQTH